MLRLNFLFCFSIPLSLSASGYIKEIYEKNTLCFETITSDFLHVPKHRTRTRVRQRFHSLVVFHRHLPKQTYLWDRQKMIN